MPRDSLIVYKEADLLKILTKLSVNGWVPLTNMATLLGYKSCQAIFMRQKTKHAIPCVRVGGTQRVNITTVLEVLNNFSASDPVQRSQVQYTLSLLKRIQHGKQNNDELE